MPASVDNYKSGGPKLLWVATHLYISWEARDPLNETEYRVLIIICFENRHGNMLTYEHRLKFWKLMLLLSCLRHAFLEFLYYKNSRSSCHKRLFSINEYYYWYLAVIYSTLKQKLFCTKARNSRKSSRNKSHTSSLCLTCIISKQ